MAQKPQTAWMWQDPYTSGASGARVNLKENEIEWFDSIGCACDDSASVQSIADFIENGPRFLTPPDDILAEMQQQLGEYVR